MGRMNSILPKDVSYFGVLMMVGGALCNTSFKTPTGAQLVCDQVTAKAMSTC